MLVSDWLSNNYIEVFGAVSGIIFVFLEIKQSLWLWPVGIITSAVYIWVFFNGKLYADMSLQGYYLVISCLGWYWWVRRMKRRQGKSTFVKATVDEGRDEEKNVLQVTRLTRRIGIILAIVFFVLYFCMWVILSHFTDSPVPHWDSFITSLSIVATWMLARKIYEHWLLWIVVNTTAIVLFMTRGLYPTLILYTVYGIMSFAGLVEWKKTIRNKQ